MSALDLRLHTTGHRIRGVLPLSVLVMCPRAPLAIGSTRSILSQQYERCRSHPRGRTKPLEMYVDADWGGYVDTRRSTTGYVAYFNSSPISWASRRQATVAQSSMEAEYVAAAEATREIIWLRSLLGELGLGQDGPTPMFVDNQTAIRLSSNPSTHARSKHIDIKHHLVREHVEFGTIKLNYIETAKQRADALTKALGGPKHASNVLRLRLARYGKLGSIRSITSTHKTSSEKDDEKMDD